ncbi:E3 ubiquitin-protein ligase rnf213-beta [Merluccius polli]|uniref:RING-type E3 ubiquitin transferase n=1 Tax=Merluccius polli TaxID=89951 RepID=A0AA47MPW1_MERPO|nr:E3 ubiquitin-protein ligase rnf213-beta [Merluccius polli]
MKGQVGSPSQNAEVPKKKRWRARRKRKKPGPGGEDTEDVKRLVDDQDQTTLSEETMLETPVEQTQTTAEAEVQPGDHQAQTSQLRSQEDNLSPRLKKHKIEVEMAHAHTQTRECETRSFGTQTSAVTRCSHCYMAQDKDPALGQSGTNQIESGHPEPDQTGESPMSESSTVETQSNLKDQPTSSSQACENAGGTGASTEENTNLKVGLQKCEDSPSGKSAVPESRLQKDATPKPALYTQAVTEGTAEVERGSDGPGAREGNRRGSQSEAERGQTSERPLCPLFTIYIHAVLDKSFRFNSDHDNIVLYHDNGCFSLNVTHCSELPQKGYLLEATLSMEDRYVPRGQMMTYSYVIGQRNREIGETAMRNMRIPPDKAIKELHLFEGYICRMEHMNLLRRMFGTSWNKPNDVGKSWQFSVSALLKRIFENWSPSNKESTKYLHRNLIDFRYTLGCDEPRIQYPDKSHPPMVNANSLLIQQVSRLISDHLLHILEGAVSEGGQKSSEPLVLALSVFVLSIRCCADLGVKGMMNLCQVLLSDPVINSSNLKEVLSIFTTPQKIVLDLINQCVRLKMSEVLLLIPLLHKLRQPEADAPGMGHTVEEEKWSGLDMVKFCYFRDNVAELKDKRKIMMTLIQNHLTVVQEMPLVLRSWLALVAFEDIPEFSDLTGVHPGHLIQALLYRLRQHDSKNIAHLNEQVPRILTHIITKIETGRVDLGDIRPSSIFLTSIDVVKSACKMARLVPYYRMVLLSYQLVLKMAAMIHPVSAKQALDVEGGTTQILDTEGGALTRPYMKDLLHVQQHVREWRDDLLRKPLLTSSKALSYPKEIAVWDALLKVDGYDEEVLLQWRSTVEKDLRKRITQSSDEDMILVCCHDSSLEAMRMSHSILQTSFEELCQSAIQNTCKRGKEGELMQTLASKVKDIPGGILSSIIVESAARFDHNSVLQLLDPQSAVSCILSQEWKELQVDDVAGEIVRRCKGRIAPLVDSLIVGHVPLGDLKTTLQHKDRFKKLYHHCMLLYSNIIMLNLPASGSGPISNKCFPMMSSVDRKSGTLESIPDDAEGILAQREKDLSFFLQQQKNVDTLIKMFAKVTESITVSEMLTLEEQHREDVWSVSLNKLMLVNSLRDQVESDRKVLWYSLSTKILKMASEMDYLHQSNLILAYWVRWAATLAKNQFDSSVSVPVTLSQACDLIWKPLKDDYLLHCKDIANATITFKRLDQALVDAGDHGDGELMKQELSLMAKVMPEHFFEIFHPTEVNWVDMRLCQIQEYRQVLGVAAAAGSVMQIATQMELSGDFSEIHNLTQLLGWELGLYRISTKEGKRRGTAALRNGCVLCPASRPPLSVKEDLFKQRTLGSLSSSLISAKQQLATVTKQQTVCLDVFLKSHMLVTWVKKNLKSEHKFSLFSTICQLNIETKRLYYICMVHAPTTDMGDVKVFVELASISAGENDTEIDQVACFHDAVMGYGPLLYTLAPTAGFNDFMTCARLVWDAQHRDEKLPDKLMDSTRLLSWLKGLKETHGSVEQSSLALASSINETGVYQIGWSKENTEKRCLQNLMCVKVNKGHTQKSYSLEELLELQNKLMLMSSKGEHGKHQVRRFTQVRGLLVFDSNQGLGYTHLLEMARWYKPEQMFYAVMTEAHCLSVFEGVQRVSAILLEMQMSGNMLYREWHAWVNCSQEGQPCIKVSFQLFEGRLIEFHGDVTEKLQQLSRSMEICHKEWCLFISEQRSNFHMLNHFTSEQLVYLCHWIHCVCHRQTPVPQQLWHLLTPIKPQCTLADIRIAFKNATGTTLTQTVEQGAKGLVEDLIQFSSEDEDDTLVDDGEAMDCSRLNKGEYGKKKCMEDLWRDFKDNMPQYLCQQLDISTLACFLSCLSDMRQQHISRKLPRTLEEGKPNLVLCPTTEVFPTTLSLYMDSPEQPLPSTDEVLVCREATTEEEVEIFLRRALGQGSKESQKRIYSLVNPGLLGYEVSVALGELFDGLERCTRVRYRLVIVSPLVHQHRYVPSFFSNHKVQAGVTVVAETSKKYIQNHFTITNIHSPVSMISPEKLSVWVVSSQRSAVGKSLYVDRLFQMFQRKSSLAQKITIRLIEPHIDMDSIVQTLSDRLASIREQDPILLHIDTAAVNSGLEEFLFQLLVLRCLCDSQGTVWRRNLTHLFMIEVLKPCKPCPKQSKEVKLLDILPTIQCRTPKEVHQLLLVDPHMLTKEFDPLMDKQEFVSEGIQRPYQFLKLFNSKQNLDPFKYQDVKGNPKDCLEYFLSNCGILDPSWAELKNFSWFLNVQLKDCENSIFCDREFLADQLPGFKDFIVKFMILMARDFASPSMDTTNHQIRKHWEREAHPYIFFNADHFSMSFLGFYVRKCKSRNTFDAVDLHSEQVLIEDVMTKKLFEGLERQHICLTEDFDQLNRQDKIKRISRVVGANKDMNRDFDPDPTYELTTDNVMKMLAIHMRFRCGIPVIIMGETGCGKTRLVRFLCDLQREGRELENMKLVKVHGGTTAEMIYRRVREAEILAEQNFKTNKLDTILFFDEANTTEAIFAIKEVLCDQTVQGKPLKSNSGLKIIAACNPYRKHTPEMVKRLEAAGLGYRVKAEETEDRLGKVPLRQLVYRVHPLPPSMASLVWDFGQLSDATELSYIKQIVQRKMDSNNLPVVCKNIISDVLAASQQFMRSQKNECSFVSLRDVERSMNVLVWFYNSDFQNLEDLTMKDRALRCLVLAVGVCYYPSLVRKKLYLSHICRCFPTPLCSAEALQREISTCQDFLLQNIQTRETIAKNAALKENVFLMVICIELKIPLFLVGKPGSSKSLAKTVVSDAMQGQNSHVELFRKLKQVHMVSFQCSPYSSPEGIIGTFKNCARFQKDKNMDEYVSVVVLDEIGLAEDSPQMPLKTLHPLLEDGCIDNDRPDPHMKVGFVGISNWALDPAKMNRGIFVSRWDPTEKELVETAKGICSSSESVFLKIKHLFPPLAKAFLKICKETAKNQFFGLRDYYSLVKMLFSIASRSQQEPDDRQLVEAILHNFSGQPECFDPLMFFHEIFKNLSEVARPSALQMIKNNLDCDSGHENRYLLLLTTNNAALYMLQQHIFANEDQVPPEIVFGSGFPKDQEYSQVCRNVNRVKTCMETGRTVILLNMQNLYESLYDALNQYYVYLSQQQYVDLGLGSHRVKCRVHRKFRLVVVEDQKKVYEHFPVPLINRLEKHRLGRSTDLTAWQRGVLKKLKEWVKDFLGHASKDFTLSDIFVGFHDDACASALLQALEIRPQTLLDNSVGQQREQLLEANTNKQVTTDVDAMDTVIDKDQHIGESVKKTEEELLELAKCFLLNCATPDSVLRLKHSELSNTEKERLLRMYFQQQRHHSLQGFLENHLNTPQESSMFLEVTTFSSLLTRSDVKTVAPILGLRSDRLLLLSLHQFDTEASFNSKIRSFLQDVEPSPHILIIQMDLEEHCSDELIASAKYCTMNYLMSLDHHSCCVVFIAKLSRIPSGSQYIGFQGGIWRSVHIDDLRDTEDMSWNLSAFCSIPISKLLHPGASEKMEMERTTKNKEEDKDGLPKEQSAHLHSLSLVRSCVQKAVGLLRDPSGVASRSMERIQTLLALLGNGQDDTNARFHEVLLGRLARALALKEETEVSPGEWLNAEARKRQALQEGGTLRHTLWRCLQSHVTPVLASVVEVVDRGANLNLLLGGQLGQGLTGLWLDIFSDLQILDLTPPQTPSALEREILVQGSIVLDGEEQPCMAPFSWLIKSYLQSLWDESEFIPVTSDDSASRIQQFVSAFNNSRLGGYLQKLSEQERVEYSHLFLKDFLLLSLKNTSTAGLMMFTKALLGCVSELQLLSSGATCDLSPAWVMAAAKHYATRLHTLSDTMLLQDQLALDVYQLSSNMREPTEMIEDILALGIFVEKTKLLNVTSPEECKVFVRQVELLQPCLERAFSHHYSVLCGPGCLQQLNSMRSTWSGMLVIAAFIQRVLFEATQGDARLKELALKHCDLLQSVSQILNTIYTQTQMTLLIPEEIICYSCSTLRKIKLMQESPDLRNALTLKQLIRILNSYDEESASQTLRYGLQCAVCLSQLKDPCLLPCRHVICLPCIKQCIRTDRKCPKCRTDLKLETELTVSTNVKAALQKQTEVRAACNSFFLEVVSRFCLSEDQSPSADVVELLFSLLISAHGEVYKTRELSPFLECVDNSPVVRSVLPKLLLQHSFDKVMGHIQKYLKNLEENILQGGDRTGLYLLFINCFQDSLLCSKVGKVETPLGRRTRWQEECRFLSRLARMQTPKRQEDPAEFLLDLARLRLCLTTAAHMLHTFSSGEASEERLEYEQYLQQVRAVLDYSGNDWYRVYLLRSLHRMTNMDFLLGLMRQQNWIWVFPPEVVRLQMMIPLEVDQFLCISPLYRAMRDTVGQALLKEKTDVLLRELQKQRSPQAHVLLALALFRQVTCRWVSPDLKLRPSTQVTIV